MGGGSGSHSRVGASSSLLRNLATLRSEFPTTPAGYFGNKGRSRENKVRVITSPDSLGTAKRFFEIAARDGYLASIKEGTVRLARFDNGTVITYRSQSHSDGSPVVEIRTPARVGIPAYQKIHFVPEVRP